MFCTLQCQIGLLLTKYSSILIVHYIQGLVALFPRNLASRLRHRASALGASLLRASLLLTTFRCPYKDQS